MPGYDIDPNDPKAIARLLVALALEKGGELRINAPRYDDIVKGHALLIEYDRSTSEIVVRVTSGKIMVVPPENQSWLRPKEEAPRQRAETQATQDVVRRTLRSDEELAELEEQLDAKTKLAREVREGMGTRFTTVPTSTKG